jgi:hypothetical protein
MRVVSRLYTLASNAAFHFSVIINPVIGFSALGEEPQRYVHAVVIVCLQG